MGACTSCARHEGQEEAEHDRDISVYFDLKKKESNRDIKILLLGAGSCGKSTILKQMKILFKGGFNQEEALAHKPVIYSNTIASMQALLAARRELNIPLGPTTTVEDCIFVESLVVSDEEAPPAPVLDRLRSLAPDMWKDEGTQAVYARRNEFNFLDSGQYFLDDISRTFAPEYVPNEQDMLRSRKATKCIVETEFWIKNFKFRMFDVGGQRGQRKKWIHLFDQASAIMFITSLSEYDQMLEEDCTRNRMRESLKLFHGIVNLPWFNDTALILFLNKDDIFQLKVTRTDIGNFFPEYKDGLDYEKGLAFVKGKYATDLTNGKILYAHVTTATDTTNINFVWNCTRHIVLQKNLEKIQLWV